MHSAQRRLWLAIEHGDLLAAREALQFGADPNLALVDPIWNLRRHDRPFELAAAHRRWPMVEQLWRVGARPKPLDSWTAEPLARAPSFLFFLADGQWSLAQRWLDDQGSAPTFIAPDKRVLPTLFTMVCDAIAQRADALEKLQPWLDLLWHAVPDDHRAQTLTDLLFTSSSPLWTHHPLPLFDLLVAWGAAPVTATTSVSHLPVVWNDHGLVFVDSDRWPLLLHALFAGHSAELVTRLLNEGADPTMSTPVRINSDSLHTIAADDPSTFWTPIEVAQWVPHTAAKLALQTWFLRNGQPPFPSDRLKRSRL